RWTRCNRCRSHDGPLSPGPDCGRYRKSELEIGSLVDIIQHNLYGNALHDLGEVSGSIVRWQQRKLRSAGRSNLDNLAVNGFPGVFIDPNFCGVANFNVGQLGLAIVRLDPLGPINERDHLRSRRYQLPRANLALANGALPRRGDLGIAEGHEGSSETRLLGAQVCLKLHFLG